jgi:hypothetical protein
MANSVPFTIELDQTLHSALLRRAAKQKTGAGDVVDAVLRRALTAEIEEAAGLPPLATVIQNVVRRTERI